MDLLFRLVCLLIGYLIGCFQTAYIVGKMTSNIDIRQHGSGNAGTTNVTRVLGRKAGIITFFGDYLKMVAAYFICAFVFSSIGDIDFVLAGMYGALGTIIGHNWPIFLKFKGGKGIASMLALFLIIDFRIGLLLYIIFLIVSYFSCYNSLCAIVVCALFPFALIVFGYGAEICIIGFILGTFAVWRHRSNIKRLLDGNESKTYLLRKKPSR